MEAIKVKAIFQGQHLSCGYEKDKEYTLLLDIDDSGKYIIIQIEGNVTSKVAYTSILTFMYNWDNIRKI